MNRIIGVIIILAIIIVGAYFFFGRDAVETAGESGGATVAAEIPEAIQKAIDFCKEKGGTVEEVVAAEGVTHLCVQADGAKAEVSKFLADNITE